MTREDINRINSQYLNDCENTWEMEEIFDLVIKALEQEPILDKIRAEINKIYEREGNSVDCLNALDELKGLIDNYKAESE